MSKQTTSFYNRFSSLYPLVDVFLKPQKEILMEQINGLPYGNLLEVGVGNGSHLQLYKKHHITAIDTSATMLDIAGKNTFPNIEFLQMSGEALSFDDESFDYVVLSHVIAVAENPDRMLEETWRVLKPNGRLLILNHFTPDNWLKYVDRSFSPISRLLHFRSFFHIDDLRAIKKFALVREESLGTWSYFKLLTFLRK